MLSKDLKGLPSILLISGDGRNTGKTSLATLIIQKFAAISEIIALKISSHFHDLTPGLIPVCSVDHFSLFMEENSDTNKDTSRMLRAGANKSYLLQANKEYLKKGFETFIKNIQANIPIICESTGLAELVQADVRFHLLNKKPQNISHLETELEFIPIYYSENTEIQELDRLELLNHKWHYTAN